MTPSMRGIMILAPPDPCPSLPRPTRSLRHRALAVVMLLSLIGAWPGAALQVPQPQPPRRWVTAATVYNLAVTWDFETGDLRGWRPPATRSTANRPSETIPPRDRRAIRTAGPVPRRATPLREP